MYFRVYSRYDSQYLEPWNVGDAAWFGVLKLLVLTAFCRRSPGMEPRVVQLKGHQQQNDY